MCAGELVGWSVALALGVVLPEADGEDVALPRRAAVVPDGAKGDAVGGTRVCEAGGVGVFTEREMDCAADRDMQLLAVRDARVEALPQPLLEEERTWEKVAAPKKLPLALRVE